MENLKVAREKAGYTQEQFAERLGVARTTVARYESGSRWPSKDMLVEMANILGCSIDYLLEEKPIKAEMVESVSDEIEEDRKKAQLVFPGKLFENPESLEQYIRQIVRDELKK